MEVAMRALGFGFVLLSVLATAPAAAQTGSPARGSQEIFDVRNTERDYFENTFRNNPRLAAESYSGALRFASCAVKFDQAGVASVLASDSGSDVEGRAIRDLTRRLRGCAVSRDSIPPLVLRGALAEALWKQGGAKVNPAKRDSVEISDVESFIKASPRGDMTVKTAGMPISWVSRCQVMALPNKAADVLAAEPGSAKEKAEAEALYANSRVCGVQKGLEKTPVIAVRAAIADALYLDGRRSAPTSAQ
jgi:hypothetical protein